MFVMVWGIEAPSDGEGWEQLRSGVFPPTPEERSGELVGLVKAMMAHDPSARPTAENIMEALDDATVPRFDFAAFFAVRSARDGGGGVWGEEARFRVCANVVGLVCVVVVVVAAVAVAMQFSWW
jgi:hypothetical protein